MRNALSTSIGVGCAVVCATPAEAQTAGGFIAGVELFDYAYREQIDAGEVKDDGGFAAIGVTYVETVGRGIFLRARLNVAFGSVDYSAPGETGRSRLEDVPQQIGQLELHVGADIRAGEVTVSPFVGLASRVLTDESGGRKTVDGLAGYDREISYGYVPVGLAVHLPLSGSARLTVSGQYNWVDRGTARSELSGLDRRLPDLELIIPDGNSLEASAAVTLPLGRTRVELGPFVRHWAIARSRSAILTDPEGSGERAEFFEPENRSTEFGLRLSIKL